MIEEGEEEEVAEEWVRESTENIYCGGIFLLTRDDKK